MTEAEWLACEEPRSMFNWVRGNGLADRQRLGLFFVACCGLIPPSVAESPSPGDPLRTDDEYGQVALMDAEFYLAGAVSEAMRAIGNGERERAALVALLRDFFGNLFCPVAFAPEWRTDTAVSLARQMYDSRDFGAMPILADALQDAGCEEASILDHCRGPGPHARGCWVVDLVLGKQ